MPNAIDRRPAQRVRCIASLDAGQPLVEDDALMIMNADTITEVNGHLLPKADRPTDMLADVTEILAVQREVATRLAAAEGRALGEKMERRPDFEPLVIG